MGDIIRSDFNENVPRCAVKLSSRKTYWAKLELHNTEAAEQIYSFVDPSWWNL